LNRKLNVNLAEKAAACDGRWEKEEGGEGRRRGGGRRRWPARERGRRRKPRSLMGRIGGSGHIGGRGNTAVVPIQSH